MCTFTTEEIEKASRIIQRFKLQKSKHAIFYNFCFCILVPQTKFKTVLEVVCRLKENYFFGKRITRQELIILISKVRFKNRKADYLLKFKYEFDSFWDIFKTYLETDGDSRAKRAFIVNRIKGMGLKVASHFLRNLGCDDLAIVDVHILKYLGIKNKNFNYLEIEDELRAQALKLGVSVAVLDAMIWSRGANIDESLFIF